ncbi:MAG: hypothetical protein RLY16_1814 [Bacteroidota bacterium]|jgi:PAS domain S-box-containing protein
MNYQEKYEQLLIDYRALQLRVTSFSATEQELINTRDQLDQELELYKRFQNYSSNALNVQSKEELLHLIAEALIDILEIECSIVYYRNLADNDLSLTFLEGFKISGAVGELEKEIVSIVAKHPNHKIKVLNNADLIQYKHLSKFSSIIFSNFTEKDLNYEIFFLGGISVVNELTYSKLQDRHFSIFSVFAHQMQSVLANRKRSEKIEEQFQQITKSSNELRKLSLIATKSKSGVIIADTYGRIEWVNDAFVKLSGYQPAEVIGKKPKDFLQGTETPEDKRKQLSDALAKKEDIEIVIINHHKSGKPYYNQLEIISVFDEQGKHINFIAIQKDITDEINSHQAIIQMNSRFELISNFSQIGIWEWDISNNQLLWNEVLFHINGMDLTNNDPQLFEIWKSNLHPDDKAYVLSGLDTLIHGNNSHIKQEYRLIRSKDKSERFLQSLTIAERDATGKLLRLIGSSQDITPVKLLQKNLEAAIFERDASLEQLNVLKSFYERILKYSPSEILVFDSNLKLLFSNIDSKTASNNWNIPINESLIASAKNNEIHQLFVDKINEAIRDKKLIQIEDPSQVINNENQFTLRSILPYYDEAGLVENIIVIGVDISELKQIQQDVLQKNEELRKINLELDHFVYSISHDLRSPLLSIKGIITYILKSNDLSAENINFLNMALTSASRLDGTIQEILEYSRNSRTNIVADEFDIIELAQSFFDDLKYSIEDPIELILDIEGNTKIHSDKSRVSVLLKNILANSIKYRRKNTNAWVKLTLRQINSKTEISISDNGEGIAPKHIERVFDMFYRATTSSVGTGLGLYICKEIANKLGGELAITSILGEGTTLNITLPINQTV